MKNKLILALMAVFFLGISNNTIAQKIGHFDIQYVIPQLPEYKLAEEEMKTYQEQLSKEFEDKKVSFEAKAKEFQTKTQQESDWTMAMIKEKETELQQLQAELQGYEQVAVQKFQEKQAKLLEPMYDKIQTALDAVAKEGGYIYILRKEAILFDLPENDISALVLKKLGVTPK